MGVQAVFAKLIIEGYTTLNRQDGPRNEVCCLAGQEEYCPSDVGRFSNAVKRMHGREFALPLFGIGLHFEVFLHQWCVDNTRTHAINTNAVRSEVES